MSVWHPDGIPYEVENYADAYHAAKVAAEAERRAENTLNNSRKRLGFAKQALQDTAKRFGNVQK